MLGDSTSRTVSEVCQLTQPAWSRMHTTLPAQIFHIQFYTVGDQMVCFT